MIKLIASDMDGTLLNDRKELPGDFFEVFDELERRGIKFTVASGRSFDAVAHLFPEEYRTRLDFICDNGANVIHEGKQVSVTPLDRRPSSSSQGSETSAGAYTGLRPAGGLITSPLTRNSARRSQNTTRTTYHATTCFPSTTLSTSSPSAT